MPPRYDSTLDRTTLLAVISFSHEKETNNVSSWKLAVRSRREEGHG